MRAAVDLVKLGSRTLWVDCDVLQADGGTRTAAITGSYVALSLAMQKLLAEQKLAASPLLNAVAAVSVEGSITSPCSISAMRKTWRLRWTSTW